MGTEVPRQSVVERITSLLREKRTLRHQIEVMQSTERDIDGELIRLLEHSNKTNIMLKDGTRYQVIKRHTDTFTQGSVREAIHTLLPQLTDKQVSHLVLHSMSLKRSNVAQRLREKITDSAVVEQIMQTVQTNIDRSPITKCLIKFSPRMRTSGGGSA